MTASLGIRVIRSSLVDWRSMKKECRHARHRYSPLLIFAQSFLQYRENCNSFPDFTKPKIEYIAFQIQQMGALAPCIQSLYMQMQVSEEQRHKDDIIYLVTWI